MVPNCWWHCVNFCQSVCATSGRFKPTVNCYKELPRILLPILSKSFCCRSHSPFCLLTVSVIRNTFTQIIVNFNV